MANSPQKPKNNITRDLLGETLRCQKTGEIIGGLSIFQRERGYRFGLDSLLLATDLPGIADRTAKNKPQTLRIAELGAAQGIVALCVARQLPGAKIVAVERQESLVELLRRNIAENQLQARVQPLHLDLREIGKSQANQAKLRAHSMDLVLCNPPYFKAGARRLSQDSERQAARHELHGEVSDFIDAARYILKQRGRLKLILPPIRLPDIFKATANSDFALERMRFFHSRKDSDAYLVESVLRRGGAPDTRVPAPLYIYKENGDYTPEVRRRVDQASQPGGAQTS